MSELLRRKFIVTGQSPKEVIRTTAQRLNVNPHNLHFGDITRSAREGATSWPMILHPEMREVGMFYEIREPLQQGKTERYMHYSAAVPTYINFIGILRAIFHRR